MRYRHLRFDIWLTLLICFGIGWCASKVAELFLPAMYEGYVQEHTVAEGDIGSKAGPEVFRAQNVEDILSHDTFTIFSPCIE